MKHLKIPRGTRAMKEPGLTPALCHPDRTMLFPAEKMPEHKKPPGEPLGSSPGTSPMYRYFTPVHNRYSISIRFGFTGRAFCC